MGCFGVSLGARLWVQGHLERFQKFWAFQQTPTGSNKLGPRQPGSRQRQTNLVVLVASTEKSRTVYKTQSSSHLLERTQSLSVSCPPSFLIDIFPKALSFDRCVQVFYGFGDEKLVKMIDEVKVPTCRSKAKLWKVTPNSFEKVRLKADSHLPNPSLSNLMLFSFQ